ncbi:MAG: tyrosine-type recombinase/integrase, partial [Ectothiorhodospira sp.]
LYRNGHIRREFSGLIPRPKAGAPLPRPLSLENAERLILQPDISTFIGLRDAAILSVLIGCGLRVSGVVALNQEDLNWVDYEGQEWLVIRVREKGKKERLVPAPHDTRLLTRAYLGHEELQEIDRTLPSGDRVLFVSTRAAIPRHEYHGERRRLSRGAILRMIDRHGERAGIPQSERHPHAARHLYGTELAEAGADILQIQALMGHADPKSSSIYTRLAMRKLTERVARSTPMARMRTPVSDLVKAIDRASPGRRGRLQSS